jgi:hypothetical protein
MTRPRVGIVALMYTSLLAGCGSEPTAAGPLALFEGSIVFYRAVPGTDADIYKVTPTGTVEPLAPALLSNASSFSAVAANGSLVAYAGLAGIVLVDPRNGGTVLDTIPQECCGSVHLAISPDGEQVAYWDGWNRELKAVRRDGTFARVLEARPDIRAPQFARVTWAGPERVLAVQWGRTAEGQPSGTAEVVEYDLRLAGARRMLEALRDIPSAMAPTDLSANADGTVLAWSVWDGEHPAKVFVANAEGVIIRTLEVIEPDIGFGVGQVSPDGRSAVFSASQGPLCVTCLAIVDLQTGATTLVGTGMIQPFPRAWLPK